MNTFKVFKCTYGTFVFLNNSTEYAYIPATEIISSSSLTQEQSQIVEKFLNSKKKRLDCGIKFPPPPVLTPELLDEIRIDSEAAAKTMREISKKMRTLTAEDLLTRTD
jgi:hypothetical protein